MEEMKKISFKKRVLLVSVSGFAIGMVSCTSVKKQPIDAVRSLTNVIFPKGEKITNDNFKGAVWVNYLAENDTVHNTSVGVVSFEPGARANWHYHKGGQILLVTEGKGLYQEKGKPIEIIEKGDVIKCSPNIVHWHGATPTDAMTHIAISTNTHRGGAVWLQPVTEEEYHSKSKE